MASCDPGRQDGSSAKMGPPESWVRSRAARRTTARRKTREVRTVIDAKTPDVNIDFEIYDADEHYYEAEDALTRHLERQFRHLVRWADIEGRRTLVVNGKLVTVVPNPTYDPVGVPGSPERYFRAENADGSPIRDIIEMQPIQPEYRERDQRVKVLDAQGVELTWLLPSLGLGLEAMLLDDAAA